MGALWSALAPIGVEVVETSENGGKTRTVRHFTREKFIYQKL